MAKKKKGLRNINPGDTVEFLNYITPDHIIRAKYNTGNNGMDITDVPQNLNSYIVLGGGSGVTVEPLSVTSNGIYTAPMGKAYTPVDVNVPVPPSVTVESLSVTSNGTYTAPTGKAYSPVDVNVPATPSVTVNGTYNAPTGKAYDPVVVNVPQTTVESLSVTSNGTYTAPEGKAYSPVNVSVSGYTLADIVTKTQPSGEIDITDLTVETYAMYGRNYITSIVGNNATIKSDAFNSCKGLLSINLTSLKTVYNFTRLFAGCSNMETAKLHFTLPSETTGGNLCPNCSKLHTLDLTITSIGTTYFQSCTLLTTIILRNPSVTTLGNTNAFLGTPFANNGSGGTIYIPETLYNHLGDGTSSDYQNATNWSTVYGYGTITWAKIEGSIYE